MTNLDSILKSRDITLPTKVQLVKAKIFPVAMYGRESWTESEWTPGVGDGQGGLACCDSWGRKESDTTEWLNWTELILSQNLFKVLFYIYKLKMRKSENGHVSPG